MNPFSSGEIFAVVDGVKYLVTVCVVSPFGGIGGKFGRGLWPGGCAHAETLIINNAKSETNAIAGRETNFFRFIGFVL